MVFRFDRTIAQISFSNLGVGGKQYEAFVSTAKALK